MESGQKQPDVKVGDLLLQIGNWVKVKVKIISNKYWTKTLLCTMALLLSPMRVFQVVNMCLYVIITANHHLVHSPSLNLIEYRVHRYHRQNQVRSPMSHELTDSNSDCPERIIVAKYFRILKMCHSWPTITAHNDHLGYFNISPVTYIYVTVLGYPPLSHPVTWWWSSSPTGLGYWRYASTYPV